MRSRPFLPLICALLLAACAFGRTKPLVKIGLVAPFEGAYRSLGYDILYGVKLALQERNERGGVGGHMLELVALDDGGDPSQAPEQAQELALDPLVMGALGHFREDTTLAASSIYREAGLALLAPGLAAVELTAGGPGVFRLGADEERLGWEAAAFMLEEYGAGRIAVLGPEGQLRTAFVSAVQAWGGEVVSRAEEGVDLVFFTGEAWEGAQLLRQIRQEGVKAPFIGGNGLDDPLFVQWAGEFAPGTIYVTSAAPVDDTRFAQSYRELAGKEPGPHALLAYEATNLLLEAMERAMEKEGRLTRQGVLEALYGPLGKVTFDPRGDQIDPPVHLYIVEDGYPGRRLR